MGIEPVPFRTTQGRKQRSNAQSLKLAQKFVKKYNLTN